MTRGMDQGHGSMQMQPSGIKDSGAMTTSVLEKKDDLNSMTVLCRLVDS